MATTKPAKGEFNKAGTESYLLTIYRAGENQCSGKDGVVGTLERLGDEDRQIFHGIEELLRLLGIAPTEWEGQGDEHAT